MLGAHCCACVFVNSFLKLALPSAVTLSPLPTQLVRTHGGHECRPSGTPPSFAPHPPVFFTTVLQHGVRADAWSSRGAGREAAAPLLTAHASPSHCAVRRCRCAVRRVVWEPGASSGTCAARSAGPTRTITRATWAGAHVGMPSSCMHAHCSRRRCLCLLRLADRPSMSMRLSQRVQEALRRRLALQGHRAGEDVRAGAAAE